MPINQGEPNPGYFSRAPSEEIRKAKPGHFAERIRAAILAAETSTTRLRKAIIESFRADNEPKVEVPITDPALKDLLAHYQQLFTEILAQVDINESKSRPDLETVLSRAIFNQELAADIYQAQNSPQARANVEKLVDIVDELAKLDKRIGLTAQALLNAARAQAGVTDYFIKQGFKVFFPDSTDDRVEKVGGVNGEMVKWDLLGGADMIAVSQDGSFFVIIDVKARFYTNGDPRLGLLDKANVTKQDEYLDPNKRVKLEAIQREIITELRSYLKKTGEINTTAAPSFLSLQIEVPPTPEHMSKIGTLSDKIKRDITNQLQKIN